MGFLQNKKALIVGVASDRSICWGIAQAMHQQGAELILTYQGDRVRSRVEDMAAQVGAKVLQLDFSVPEQLQAVVQTVQQDWGGLDIAVHGAAFAPKEELSGPYLDAVTAEGFRIAHEVSSYSFTALAKAVRPLMQGRAGALLTTSR